MKNGSTESNYDKFPRGVLKSNQNKGGIGLSCCGKLQRLTNEAQLVAELQDDPHVQQSLFAAVEIEVFYLYFMSRTLGANLHCSACVQVAGIIASPVLSVAHHVS